GFPINEFITLSHKKSINGYVEKLRYIKSSTEIELIEESCRWGNMAHSLLVQYTEENAKEKEVAGKAGVEAKQAMYHDIGPDSQPFGSPSGSAVYRGQIGPHSAFTHSQNQSATFKKGYNFVTQAAAFVWGYTSELERTMFIKEV